MNLNGLFSGTCFLTRLNGGGRSACPATLPHSLIPAGVVLILFSIFALFFAFKAQKRRITTGMKGLIGEPGSAITNLDPKGRVFVRGEYWNALACEGMIKKGEEIEVVAVERLRVKVRRKMKATTD